MVNNYHQLKIGYIMQADSVQMHEVSGPQLHVSAIIRELKKRGHQVRLLSIQKGTVQWSDDLIEYHPCSFGRSASRPYHLVESALRGIQSRLHLPFIRFFDSYRFSDACISALTGYDILYERFGIMSYGALIGSRRLGIPLIYEVNGDLLEEYNQLGIQLSKGQWTALDFTARMMFQYADHTICVADSIKQRIVNRWHLDPSKFSVIPNGVDLDAFLDLIPSPDTRTRFAIGDGQVIIFIGSFMPWHGIDLLIDAFAQISSNRPDLKLVLVGDGPVWHNMQSKVKALNLTKEVLFTGSVNHQDVASLLSVADIAVVYDRASRAANPLKLFEYMAAGKAIIAPDVPNMQLILTDRKNARLIPPDSPEALSPTLTELLDDDPLRLNMGMAARQQAIERHSWDRTAADVEATLLSFTKI